MASDEFKGPFRTAQSRHTYPVHANGIEDAEGRPVSPVQAVALLNRSPARDQGVVAPCGTCLGYPHVSGKVCVCGGKNTQAAEVEGLRVALANALYTHPTPSPDAREQGAVAIVPTHEAADAFWAYWRANGETHKHGYYESTWGAINAALRVGGVVPHSAPAQDKATKGPPYSFKSAGLRLLPDPAQVEDEARVYIEKLEAALLRLLNTRPTYSIEYGRAEQEARALLATLTPSSEREGG